MDMIDRQAAIERIVSIRPSTPKQSDYSHGVDVGLAMAMVSIKEQPSAEPEIVRCKDCIYRRDDECDYVDFWLQDDYFCSRGERKDGTFN